MQPTTFEFDSLQILFSRAPSTWTLQQSNAYIPCMFVFSWKVLILFSQARIGCIMLRNMSLFISPNMGHFNNARKLYIRHEYQWLMTSLNRFRKPNSTQFPWSRKTGTKLPFLSLDRVRLCQDQTLNDKSGYANGTRLCHSRGRWGTPYNSLYGKAPPER